VELSERIQVYSWEIAFANSVLIVVSVNIIIRSGSCCEGAGSYQAVGRGKADWYCALL